MGLRQWVGILFAVTCVGSIALRASLGEDPVPFGDPPTVEDAGSPSVAPNGIVAPLVGSGSSSGPTTQPASENPPPADPAAEPSALEDALPVVTEASFFGLIGFALGYASKKILKLAMIFLAIFFAMLQVLVFLDIATLDWDRAVELVNGVILNLKQDRSFTEVITARIPAAATLLGGFLVGFRRG